MKVASTRSSVAGSGKGHAGLSSDLEGQRRACGDRHVVGQMADESDHPAFQIAHMNIAVFSFGRATLLAEVLGDDFSGGKAANEKRAHIAVKRRNDVIRPQRRGITDGDRLHPMTRIDAADDAALPVERADPVFQASRQPEVVVHIEEVAAFDFIGDDRNVHDDLRVRWPGTQSAGRSRHDNKGLWSLHE